MNNDKATVGYVTTMSSDKPWWETTMNSDKANLTADLTAELNSLTKPSDAETLVSLMKEMLDIGVIPKTLRVGDVEVTIASYIAKGQTQTAAEQSTKPSSYLNRAINEHRRSNQ